jgi:hypothetical protein
MPSPRWPGATLTPNSATSPRSPRCATPASSSLVVEDAEHRIALEVDRIDVLHQRRFADDVLEAQAQVFRLQRQENGGAAPRGWPRRAAGRDGLHGEDHVCARPGAIQAYPGYFGIST